MHTNKPNRRHLIGKKDPIESITEFKTQDHDNIKHEEMRGFLGKLYCTNIVRGF